MTLYPLLERGLDLHTLGEKIKNIVLENSTKKVRVCYCSIVVLD